MRIALITDGIWPYVVGGMQKHSYFLCKYFAKKGIYVDLVHFNKSNLDITLLECFTPEEKKFIKSIIIDFPISAKFPGHYIYNSYQHSKLIYDQLKNQLTDYNFIYTKGFTGWYLINSKNSKHIKCCTIGVNFHGYEVLQPAPSIKVKIQQFLFLKKTIVQLSRKADVVFSYGGKITKLIQSVGIRSEKIIEMPSGVEFESIVNHVKPCHQTIRFLFIGRYERRKGVEELNSAINSLIKQKQNFEFHFIGNIPVDKKINHAAVFYHGEMRDKTILFNEIQKNDVLICPSFSEGFPNVILEAMASGLAIAATQVGAVELLVDNKVGWIIKEPTSKEIEIVLNEIIQTNPALIDSKKQEALNKVKTHFNWDIIITKLIEKIQTFL